MKRLRKLGYWHDALVARFESGGNVYQLWRQLEAMGVKVQPKAVYQYMARWQAAGCPDAASLGWLDVQRTFRQVEIEPTFPSLAGDKKSAGAGSADQPAAVSTSSQVRPIRQEVKLGPRKVERVNLDLGLGEDPLEAGWCGYGRDLPWWEVLAGKRGAGEKMREWKQVVESKGRFAIGDLAWENFGWMDFFGAERWSRFTEQLDEPQDQLLAFAVRELRVLWWEICAKAVTNYRVYPGSARKVQFIIEGQQSGWLKQMEVERRDYLQMPRWWRRRLEVAGWMLPLEKGWGDLAAWEMEGGDPTFETALFRGLWERECQGHSPLELDESALPAWYLEYDEKDWRQGVNARKVN